MDPISMITSFFGKVFGYVKSGLDWRHLVNTYETNKSYYVAQKYRFSIFPLEFVSIRHSLLSNSPDYHNLNGQNSSNNYASTFIKVKDIYPFILNAHSSAVFVRSFWKSDPSALDGQLLDVGYGYVLGSDLKWQAIDANHIAYDRPGTPGILSFSTHGDDIIANRRAHVIHETGKAYALAPNVEPNIITEAQVLVKDENWIYGVIFLLIFMAIIIKSKQKTKK